jgi:hypothetical protein
MNNLMTKPIGDRKEWKRMQARANADANRYDRYLEKWRNSRNQDVKKQL